MTSFIFAHDMSLFSFLDDSFFTKLGMRIHIVIYRVLSNFKPHVYYVYINNFIYYVSINNFLEQHVYSNMLFMYFELFLACHKIFRSFLIEPGK